MEGFEKYFDELVPADEPSVAFGPCARYFPSMDMFTFVTEDAPHRTEPVDGFLTLLYHPQEEKLIGLKLKGFNYVFSAVKESWGLTDEDFVTLVELLEIGLSRGLGESIIDSVRERRKKYLAARALVLNAPKVRVSDLEFAA